jgi:uncharacterized protein (TIGR00299 family) protein
MSKILYFDCVSGISGDMTIGAFLDLGVDQVYLKRELAKLDVSGYELTIGKKLMRGMSGTDFDVVLSEHHHEHHHHDDHDHEHKHHHHDDHNHDHDHNHDNENHQHEDHVHDHKRDHEHDHHEHSTWGQIKSLIEKSTLTDAVKSLSIRIFQRVAEAEAKVHGVSIENVHFHEVGAVDSIVDIIGAAICYDYIKPDKVIFSPLNTGSGTVKCSHGILPVPAPATAEILAKGNAKIYSNGTMGELVTPTGAAIAVELANEFGILPAVQIEKTGYGTGKKDFGIPNVLRVIQGSSGSSGNEDVIVLEANIDDMSGEIAGYTLDRLMSEGALDAFFTPIFMKKNRPAVKLSVLCLKEQVKKLERIILAESTTIGIRKYATQRTVMKREIITVMLPYGEVDVKVCEYEGIKKASPEYESVKELAQRTGFPLLTIYKDIYSNIDLF